VTSDKKKFAAASGEGLASITELNISASTGALYPLEVTNQPLAAKSSQDCNDTQLSGHCIKMPLVDDEPNQTEVLRMLFELEGIDASVAVNGDDAVARIHKARPQGIVTDHIMLLMNSGEMQRSSGPGRNPRRCLT
jgi:hypothetical protein